MGLTCLSFDWAIGLSRKGECELDFMSLGCSDRCLNAARLSLLDLKLNGGHYALALAANGKNKTKTINKVV